MEFDFRYSNRIRLGVDDAERTQRAIQGAEGRRLYYRQPRSRAARATLTRAQLRVLLRLARAGAVNQPAEPKPAQRVFRFILGD